MMNTKEEKKIQNYHVAGLREVTNSRIDEQLDETQHIYWTIKIAKRTIKLNNRSTISKAPSPGSLKYGKLIISRLIIQPYAIITTATRLNPKSLIL